MDILKVHRLEKSFGDFKVLNGINLSVHEHDVYGFLGPNGAGKSTTIRIIASLISADSGFTEIFGKDVSKNKKEALAQVGMLIEKPAFYEHLTARRNLSMIVKILGLENHSEVDRVLKLVDLTDTADKKIKKYSQGMKQRLGIAQALMGNPKLIILDEPTNGLDPVSMREIRHIIKRMVGEGCTVFLSSHLLYEVERMCNRMAIINKGHILKEGGVTELIFDSPVFWVEFKVDNETWFKDILKSFDILDIHEQSIQGIKIKISQNIIPELVKAATDDGLKIYSIQSKTTLEDYFINMIEAE